MKRPSKKLTINKETIKHLQEELLIPVQGGGTSGLCPSAATSCPAVSCYDCPDLT